MTKKKKKRTNTGIPGLSFSWKRMLGISRMRHKIARKTGIPTTKSGIQRKVGRGCLRYLFPVVLVILLLGLCCVCYLASVVAAQEPPDYDYFVYLPMVANGSSEAPGPTPTPAPPSNWWLCPDSFEGAAYAGSAESNKFHRLDCFYVDRILSENLICFASREAAIATGYSPCGHCNP